MATLTIEFPSSRHRQPSLLIWNQNRCTTTRSHSATLDPDVVHDQRSKDISSLKHVNTTACATYLFSFVLLVGTLTFVSWFSLVLTVPPPLLDLLWHRSIASEATLGVWSEMGYKASIGLNVYIIIKNSKNIA
jgi:hypothetical protein